MKKITFAFIYIIDPDISLQQAKSEYLERKVHRLLRGICP